MLAFENYLGAHCVRLSECALCASLKNIWMRAMRVFLVRAMRVFEEYLGARYARLSECAQCASLENIWVRAMRVFPSARYAHL